MIRNIYSYKKALTLLLFSLSSVLFAVKASDFKVIIDAGHGGKDPGAIGHYSKEKDINLGVALALGEMIKSRNPDVKVIYTRDKDFFVELQERANIANRSKAQLFISIHTNSAASSSANGTETYTLGLRRSNENLEVAKRENSVILLEDNYKVKYAGFDPTSSESYIMFEMLQDRYMDQSISIASAIQSEFRKAKCVDRGVRQDVFLVLRNTGMPSVLVEVGYISNRNEEDFLNSNSGRQKLAESIYNAFSQFKRNYEKRQAVATYQPLVSKKEKDQKEIEPNQTNKNKEIKQDTTAREKKAEIETSTQNAAIYKVQIMATSIKLKDNASDFKGEKGVESYKEKGLYKYTLGNSTDEKEIKDLQQKLSAKFKGCFVIGFRNGEKFIVK